MQRPDYDPKTITDCVQDVFGSQQGQVVLEWMEDLYLRYKAQSLITSNSPNLSEMLAYKAGKADVVIELRHIFEHGLEDPRLESTTLPDEDEE